MISTRFYENGPVAIYEALWACNQTLLISAIALLTNDPFIIRAALVTISFDQLLWYVDILGYLIRRKFFIGVAKYIIWP